MKRRPRILFAGNFLERHWGAGRTGIDMRLAAGATRLGWPSLAFSERDVARFLAPFGFMRGAGARMMNSRLAKTARNWRPDVVFISHCDYVENRTLDQIRASLPEVRIVHINCDPVATDHCQAQIRRRMHSCDAIFTTTAGEKLKEWTTGRNIVGFFPNPSDDAFETEDNSQKTDFRYDLFFAGRPALADARAELLADLAPRLPDSVRRGFFGMGFGPLVTGRDYEEAIAASKAGLSINRFEGWKWYASDRITHMMANGLLAYQYGGNSMQDFFDEGETVYFSAAEDLAEKVAFYNSHDGERRRIAAAGRAKYRALFDSTRVLEWMVGAVLGWSGAHCFEWSGEVYR